jgi:hypothetical protein
MHPGVVDNDLAGIFVGIDKYEKLKSGKVISTKAFASVKELLKRVPVRNLASFRNGKSKCCRHVLY